MWSRTNFKLLKADCKRNTPITITESSQNGLYQPVHKVSTSLKHSAPHFLAHEKEKKGCCDWHAGCRFIRLRFSLVDLPSYGNNIARTICCTRLFKFPPNIFV